LPTRQPIDSDFVRKAARLCALALFVAVWGVIGVQLASGHDPALKKSDATSSSNSSSATSSSRSDDELTTSDDSSSDVSPVTTQQS